jgi:Domain of unknown function (DUF4157)
MSIFTQKQISTGHNGAARTKTLSQSNLTEKKPSPSWSGSQSSTFTTTNQNRPINDNVLHSNGQPLDAAIRAYMEPRFGHDFSKVRVHSDARAAESARAVHARACTVGYDIVMGAGQFAPGTPAGQRLLAHELAHVVQQSRTPNGGVALQRAGLKDGYTTEGQLVHGPAPATDLAVGLPEPDCSTRFADLFILGAIYHPQRPECCFAQIHDRKDTNRNGIFRADYLIEGKPDCEYGDQKSHDFWIGPWRIVEITPSQMTVMNMCGIEETLDAGGSGTGKGEPGLANVSGKATEPQPAGALPANKVEDSKGTLGKTHETRYDEQCEVVMFKPNDPSKPASLYRWDPAQEAYVNEAEPTNTKTPGQLERMAGIILREYIDGKWQSKNCGDQPAWVP